MTNEPAYEWHTFYGADDEDEARGVSVDDEGNVYVVGWSDAGWLGDGAAAPRHEHSGSRDIVVVKLSNSGEYQWHTFYGSSNWDEGHAIATDSSGNVYVTGWSAGTWLGDGDKPPKREYSKWRDVFVLKLDSGGTYQWHTFFGGSGQDAGHSIRYAGGYLYIAGESDAPWQGSGISTPIHAHSGGKDMMALKLTDGGECQWHTFYGSSFTTYTDTAFSIAVDESGNSYLAGWSNSPWEGDDGADPLHEFTGETDTVVLKLNNAGGYEWHTFYGSDSYDFGGGIAVDDSGNVSVVGGSYENWEGDSGEDPLHGKNEDSSADIAILQLTSAGAYQWHSFYGVGGANDVANAIDLDESGNLYITGTSNGTWLGDDGAQPFRPCEGGEEIAVLTLSSNGAYRFHTFFGWDGIDRGNAIIVGANRLVHVAGGSWSTWKGDHGEDPIHPFSDDDEVTDMTIVKLVDAVRLQDETPGIEFNGWRTVEAPNASGGSYRASSTKGDSITFKFKGTSVSWITCRGPHMGKAQVTLDGVSKGTFDLYSENWRWQVKQSFKNLANTKHTLVIKVLGAENSSASDGDVAVDAFKVGSTMIQESAPGIKYNKWKIKADASASGGSYHSSGSAKAVARVVFYGSRVAWVTAVGPGYGKADVYLDGHKIKTYDLYHPTQYWNTMFGFSGMSWGQHTLEIRVLGTKNNKSVGNSVVVDAAVVPAAP